MILTGIGIIDSTRTVPLPVEQTFTANGTWSCCSGATCIEVLVIGAGGGGNSGARDTRVAFNGRLNIGGAGGGGGGIALATLSGAQVPSSVCVIVGTGGNGGQANSANCSDGYVGTNGGASCFGSCVVANGGRSCNSANTNGGGYSNVGVGGVNDCAGGGGTAVINTGTGTACSGGNGGGMGTQIGLAAVQLVGGPPTNVAGTFRPRGGAGGGGSSCCAQGAGGSVISGTVCCGICIGNSGCGGSTEGAAGGNGQAYGAGGGGGHASNSPTAEKAGNGAPGVVKVIQYF
jgi:hypothetical protein